MNHTELRDFKAKTLLMVSRLIDKRIIEIRQSVILIRTPEENEEIAELLEFQTQTLYARALVLHEEKVMNQ